MESEDMHCFMYSLENVLVVCEGLVLCNAIWGALVQAVLEVPLYIERHGRCARASETGIGFSRPCNAFASRWNTFVDNATPRNRRVSL
jgi:hypothetical protein